MTCAEPRGEAMRRPGKAVKTQRRKTLRRRNTPKAYGVAAPRCRRGNKCRPAYPRARRGAAATDGHCRRAQGDQPLVGRTRTVFVTILDKALDLCEAAFGFATTYDGERFGPLLSAACQMLCCLFQCRNGPTQAGRRTLATACRRRAIHFLDQKDDDAYGLARFAERSLT
jgi:hypothetical protein